MSGRLNELVSNFFLILGFYESQVTYNYIDLEIFQGFHEELEQVTFSPNAWGFPVTY